MPYNGPTSSDPANPPGNTTPPPDGEPKQTTVPDPFDNANPMPTQLYYRVMKNLPPYTVYEQGSLYDRPEMTTPTGVMYQNYVSPPNAIHNCFFNRYVNENGEQVSTFQNMRVGDLYSGQPGFYGLYGSPFVRTEWDIPAGNTLGGPLLIEVQTSAFPPPIGGGK